MIIRALLRILLSLHRGDEPCECGRAFDEARALVEANYAGFQDKTAGARGLEYRARTIAAREEAARARNFAECFQAISGWIGFFQDGHTVLIANPRAAQEFSGLDSAAIRALFPDWPRRDWTEAMLRSYLDKNRGSLAPIEGIWETPGYRLAIVRDSAHKDQFLSVVLSADSVWWMPGQIKALYKPSAVEGWYDGIFYLKDHTPRNHLAVVRRGTLLHSKIGGLILYSRSYPRENADATPAEAQAYLASVNYGFRIDSLSPRTWLIRMSSFDREYADTVAKLFAKYDTQLRSAENLIVDVRGNGGGVDRTYAPLIPLIYTGPIRKTGVELRVSQENLRRAEESLREGKLSDAEKRKADSEVARLRAASGGFASVQEDFEIVRDSVLPRPRRVVVLADRGCTSSCEEFVLTAMQSGKVTLAGDRTGGVLDYASMRARQLSTCSRLIVRYATTRSRRLPEDRVDPLGITPHVKIPLAELDAPGWLRRWLEGKSGL